MCFILDLIEPVSDCSLIYFIILPDEQTKQF